MLDRGGEMGYNKKAKTGKEDEKMKDDIRFLRLWDLYSPLLTETQREITDLYFNFDLSICEIAEEKGVSRQSVFNCLHKSRQQLEALEKQLGFAKALDALSGEYSAYMTEVVRWIAQTKEEQPSMQSALGALETRLQAVHEEYGAEKETLENGEVLYKTLRGEK